LCQTSKMSGVCAKPGFCLGNVCSSHHAGHSACVARMLCDAPAMMRAVVGLSLRLLCAAQR
jgi:hypothetical protein